jgi:5-methylcytosine-specific restriction endonuclease McrA
MPIRPEYRHFYRGPAWRAIRGCILIRARHCCEQCGKPNHQLVWVYSSKACGQYWTLLKGVGQKWHYCLFGGSTGSFTLFPGQWGGVRRIRVQLHVAHLNHTPGDDRPENLKALCQWCHLNLDKLEHKRTRSIRKDARRPVLAATEATC